MESDVELYNKSTSHYDLLQGLRPDYTGAESAFIELSCKYIGNIKDTSITDFCCGTGINTKNLAEKIPIASALLIDINKDFLDIAKKSGIKSQIKVVADDILNVNFPAKSDLVISMFAYHHVPDNKKSEYVSQVRDALKQDGLLLLGEIFIPSKTITIEYYKYLYDQIPEKSSELEKFLTQTANSDEFEYKVSRKFAHDQFTSCGFELLESRKIWPSNNYFSDSDIGTFVEVWRKK